MKVSEHAPSIQKEFDQEHQELQRLSSRTGKAGRTVLRLENGHFKTGQKGRFKYWGLKVLRAVAPYMSGFCDKRLSDIQHINDAQQKAAASRISHMTQHAKAPTVPNPDPNNIPLSQRTVITVGEAVNYINHNPSVRFTADRNTWIIPPTLDSNNPWRVNPDHATTPDPQKTTMEDNLKLEYRVVPDNNTVQEKLKTAAKAVEQQQRKIDDESDALDSGTSEALKSKSRQKKWEVKRFQDFKEFTATGELPEDAKTLEGEGVLQSEPVTLTYDYKTIPDSGKAGEAHAQGARETMEDATLFTTINVTTSGGTHTLTLSGMFDGHGSSAAAEFARANIAQYLQKRLEEGNPDNLTDTQIWNALKLAFVDTSHSFKTPEGLDTRTGTTANLVLQNPETGDIWVANAGDSRALMVSPDGKTTQLSEDAKPKDDKFKASIEKRGGTVSARGRVNNMVGSARGIGDHSTYGASTARPKITKYSRPEAGWQGYTLVQACDGLFDVTSSKTVGNYVHQSIQKNATCAYIASQLVESAYKAESGDNISVMVMPLS